MAHNLATTNGKSAMMYTGEAPWHRLTTIALRVRPTHSTEQAADLIHLGSGAGPS